MNEESVWKMECREQRSVLHEAKSIFIYFKMKYTK